MKPKRVCFVSTFYPPYNFGGDGIAVQRLARGFSKWGWDVTVVHEADAQTVLTGGDRPQPDPTDPAGVRVVTLVSRSPLLNTLLMHQLGRPVLHASRLHRLLDEGGFDAVLFNNVSLAGGPALLGYGGSAARLYLAHEHWLVCPTHVLWRHDRELCDRRECIRCQLRHHRPPQLWRFSRLLESNLAKVDMVIAMSQFSRAKHRELGFRREMEVLPCFVPDPEPSVAREWERAPSPHERPYVLFVGRLEQLKGLEDLLDVMASYDGCDLVVVGEGTQGDALRRRAAGNPSVRFVGRLRAWQLAPYYRHALALVAPSRAFETFGLVIIEAFSQGTPVIARRLGAYPEIVERSGGGLLFSTTDELRRALRTLVDSPDERGAMAARALDSFRRNWSEAAVVPRYLEAVDEACARRRRRS